MQLGRIVKYVRYNISGIVFWKAILVNGNFGYFVPQHPFCTTLNGDCSKVL